MTEKIRVFNASQVKGFTMEGYEDSFVSRLLIDASNTGCDKLTLNEFTLKKGKQTYKGNHGKDFDEVYFVLEGKVKFYLETEIGSDEYTEYNFKYKDIAFIKGGTGHYLINDSDEDVVLLTFMMGKPVPGINVVYDERLEKWGKSFLLEEKD